MKEGDGMVERKEKTRKLANERQHLAMHTKREPEVRCRDVSVEDPDALHYDAVLPERVPPENSSAEVDGASMCDEKQQEAKEKRMRAWPRHSLSAPT